MYLLRNSTQRSGIQLAMPWGGFQRVGVVFSWFSASAHRWTHTNKRVPPHPLQLPAHKHKVAFLLEWFLPLTAEALTGKSVNCLSYDLAYHKGSHLFSTYMTIFDSMHASTASPNKIFVCFFFFFFTSLTPVTGSFPLYEFLYELLKPCLFLFPQQTLPLVAGIETMVLVGTLLGSHPGEQKPCLFGWCSQGLCGCHESFRYCPSHVYTFCRQECFNPILPVLPYMDSHSCNV